MRPNPPRVLLLILSLCCACALRADAASSPCPADSLHQAALARLGQVPVKESLAAFESVLKADPDYAPAHYEIARLYMGRNTPTDRYSAQKALRRAIVLDPGNVEYQLKMGELRGKQGFWYNAARQYESILESHPDNAEAAYQAGYYALKEFLKYIDRITVVKSQSMDPFEVMSARPPRARDGANPFDRLMATSTVLFSREFGEKDRDRAEAHLEQSIKADPGRREAYYQLGLIKLESGRPEGLVETARALLAHVADDKDALMFCALGHQVQGEMDTAYVYYSRAIARMAPGERMEMEDVRLIATEEDEAFLASADPGAPADTETGRPDFTVAGPAFWTRRDPLYLTEYNERRMAHYGRFAYANLRFYRPRQEIPGWQTDMGKAYIKFGRYLHRTTQIPPGSYAVYETWFYRDFQITFRDWDGLDAYRFSSDGVSSRHVFETTPPVFTDPYVGRKYSLPHQIAAFREGDSVRVELSYALPRARLELVDGVADLEDGLFLFDANWHSTRRQVRNARVKWPVFLGVSRTRADSIRRSTITSSRTLRIKRAPYHIVVEVLDRKAGNIGTLRQFREFSAEDGQLAISDLLLARRIEPRQPFPSGRQDLAILPNPIRTYVRQEPIHVYLEVYNLQKDRYGRTAYDISYRTGRPARKEIDPGLFEAHDLGETEGRLLVEAGSAGTRGSEAEPAEYRVRYVLPERNRLSATGDRSSGSGKAGDAETAVTARYEGDREDDFTYLRIDVGQVTAGVHELTVTVRDANSGRTAERSALFRVVE